MAKRKRAANGRGSMTYDEKRELYTFRVSVGHDKDGKVKRKSFSGKTQQSVMEKYDTWKDEMDYYEDNIYDDVTLAEFGQKWLASYSHKIEESSAVSYKYTLKIIVREIGDMPIMDIKPRNIEKLLERLTMEYSKSVVGKVRTMLHQILRKAEADDIIRRNPVPLAERTDYRRVRQSNGKAKDAWSIDEIKRLMRDLPDDRVGHSIRLMLGTGIGAGELLALKKEALAADGSWVKIEQALKIGERSRAYIGSVKAEKRYRMIKVPPTVRESVIYLHDAANEYIIEGQKHGFPMYPTTYRGHFKNAIASVEGVRVLTPHCCRHAYVSHLYQSVLKTFMFLIARSALGWHETRCV